MKFLLQQYSELQGAVAIMQDRNITNGELWNEVEALADCFHYELIVQKEQNVSICAAGSILCKKISDIKI